MKLQHAERSALGMQQPSLNHKATINRDKGLYGEWQPAKRRRRRGRSGKAQAYKLDPVTGQRMHEIVPPKPERKKAAASCKPGNTYRWGYRSTKEGFENHGRWHGKFRCPKGANPATYARQRFMDSTFPGHMYLEVERI